MMLLLAGLAAAACPSLDAEVERATRALVGGDAATVEAALADAEASFACAPAARDDVARWMLVVGAHRVLRGQDGATWLAASRALAPDGFDPRLGPGVRVAFDGAAAPASATLLLEPALPAVVDGAPVSAWPLALPAGPHTVQVLDAGGAVRFGRALTLLPGEDALLPTSLPASVAADTTGTGSTATAPAVPAGPTARPQRHPALLITAAGLAAAGGALTGAALAQTPRMEAAADTDALDAAYGAQQGLAWGAYGAFGAAAVTGLLFVVVR